LTAFVESAATAGHRDDGACAHAGELGDQVRTDIAGGADDQMAAVGVEYRTGSRGLGGVALQPRNVAYPGPIHHLVLAIVAAGLGQYPGCGQDHGYRFVQIDEATPDFGML